MAKRDTTADVVGIIGAVVLIVGLILLVPWLVMLLFGVWHSVREAVPAISFGEAWLLTVIAGLLTARPSRSNN